MVLLSAVLFFDYLLTFDMEVSEIWKSKPSATMILLFMNRYLSILYWVLQIIATFLVTNNDRVSMNRFLRLNPSISDSLTIRRMPLSMYIDETQ